jgi:GxxExxY protein
MNADERFSVENAITERVISCAFKVHNALGCGHKEKVYENAMPVLFRHESIAYGQKIPYPVTFMGEHVGLYEADLVVMDRVIVEMKAVAKLEEEHVGQCLNYLKAANLKIGLLLNFGRPRLEIRRVIFTT